MLQHGYEAFQEGDYERSLLHYLRASEMGFELGQSNAAWLLTHVRSTDAGAHVCYAAESTAKTYL